MDRHAASKPVQELLHEKQAMLVVEGASGEQAWHISYFGRYVLDTQYITEDQRGQVDVEASTSPARLPDRQTVQGPSTLPIQQQQEVK